MFNLNEDSMYLMLLIEFGFALAVVVEKELALVAAEAPHAGNHAALDGHTRLLQRVTSTNYDEALFRLTGLRAVVGLADLDTYFSIVRPRGPRKRPKTGGMGKSGFYSLSYAELYGEHD